MESNYRTFIDEVVDEILQDQEDLRKVLIIIPNRRAGQYILRSIARQRQSVSWSPKIETLNNWLTQYSDRKVISNTDAIFHLYKAYVEVYPDPEPFSEFFKWGQMILNDFNEIDRYLLQPQDVFKNLLKIQEIENWSFDEDEISKTQEQLHEFWLKLEPLYRKFKTLLHDKNAITSSHLFRDIAENENLLFSLADEFEKVYFIGFNALSKAEETIFNALIKRGKGKVCVDADVYYAEDSLHEAGTFYRRIFKKWGKESVSLAQNNLLQSNVNFDVVGSPTAIGQVSNAISFLEQIPKEEHAQTVVVLADEDMIWTVLTALPKSLGAVNVTMGIALKWTPLQPLLNDLLGLQQSHSRMQSRNNQFYYQTLIPILQHPFIAKIAKSPSENLVQYIIEKNQIYVSRSELEKYFSKQFIEILDPWNDWKVEPIKKLQALTRMILDEIPRTEALNLELEMMLVFANHLDEMVKTFQNIEVELDPVVFKRLFFQYWQQQRIDLMGNPLDDIQLMGMLETRSLTFKNVVILGLNEGIFPKTKRDFSVIPYDLKHFFKLPTQADRDAIFANHFYRLVQRAENVMITYGTTVEGIQENEKSRYITQLEYELTQKNPKAKFKEHFHAPFTKNAILVPPSIEKTKTIIEQVIEHLEKGISPSALNTYLTCPMDYYYKYVLKLKEEDEVEEEMSNASFGTVIHEVLEQLYKPFEGKQLKKSDVEQMQNNYKALLDEAYNELFRSNTNYSFGLNKISYDVSQSYISKFLKEEINRFDDEYKSGITILELESEYESLIPMEVIPGKEIKVRIYGKIDRVDQVGEKIRVIDYKTGKADAKETSVDWEKLTIDQAKTKANQLMMYTLIYPGQKPIEAGIYSLRTTDEKIVSLTIGKETIITDADKKQYTLFLKTVFKEMLDASVNFEHNVNADYCERCLL